jgi:uncharacterized protein YneF (UPF0154 family)
MTLVIQILISLILLAILVISIIGIVYLLSLKPVKQAIKEVKPIKKEAIIFDDEPKTEEEIAIEREERILKIIGAKK